MFLANKATNHQVIRYRQHEVGSVHISSLPISVNRELVLGRTSTINIHGLADIYNLSIYHPC